MRCNTRTNLSALRGAGASLKLALGGALSAVLAAASAALSAVQTVEVPVEAWVQGYRYERPFGGYDSGRAVAIDNDGNVAVTGYSSTGNGTGDYYTAKYAAADGSMLWERRYNGASNLEVEDKANTVKVDTGGNVIVTGDSYSIDGHVYYTAKYAAINGAVLWEQRYDAPYDEPTFGPGLNALALDSRGNVLVAGPSGTLKYAAASGALLWEKAGTNHSSKAMKIVVDHHDDVVVSGGRGTRKYAGTDGALLWERTLPPDSEVRAVAVDASGDVAIAGTSLDSFGLADYCTAKLAGTDGSLLWEQRYDGASTGEIISSWDMPNAVAVDASGNVVVTGLSRYGYYTAKYAAPNGALLWERRYYSGHLPHSQIPEANAVAVDTAGNVIVTGYSLFVIRGDKECAESGRCGWFFGYYTGKYVATDGALLWEQHYNGPGNDDVPVETSYRLALGQNGTVAITGTSFNGITTVKYVMTQVTYPTPVVLSLAVTSEGARLRFTGDAGHTYRLQRASDPTGPWTTFTALTAPSEGAVEHLDSVPLGSPVFYRVAAP